MNEEKDEGSEQQETKPARNFNRRVVGATDLEQHQMNTGDDQTKQTCRGQRDVNLLERIHRLEAGVVERVVLLSDGFLFRTHEFVNRLPRLYGKRHSVEEIGPQWTRALVSHDTCCFGKGSVPFVDKGLNALHFGRQFAVIPHLFEDVKNRLRTNLANRKNAHSRDEHVHFFLDQRGRALYLQDRKRHRSKNRHGGQQYHQKRPSDARKQGPLSEATREENKDDGGEKRHDTGGSNIQGQKSLYGHLKTSEGYLPNRHALHVVHPQLWLMPTHVSTALSKCSQPFV